NQGSTRPACAGTLAARVHGGCADVVPRGMRTGGDAGLGSRRRGLAPRGATRVTPDHPLARLRDPGGLWQRPDVVSVPPPRVGSGGSPQQPAARARACFTLRARVPSCAQVWTSLGMIAPNIRGA